MNFRTDLAIEAKRLWDKSMTEKTKLNGVAARETERFGVPIDIVEIINAEGSSKLDKPVGTYVTIDLGRFFRKEPGSFRDTCEAFASVLYTMMPKVGNVLVVGLGNAAIMADAVGPEALNNLVVTRHLTQREIPAFHGFCAVSAVAPGVLGKTGVESLETVLGILEKVKPDCVIVVDALASCEPERLCLSVQVTDTGIVPGSGVGNHRAGFTKESLGVPVYAVGVPTVVDGETFLAIHRGGRNVADSGFRGDLVLTSRDIDLRVPEIGKLIGYGIDLALQHKISFDDIPGFLS